MKPHEEKRPEEPDGWSGLMTCAVINLTGKDVKTVKITHKLGKYTNVGIPKFGLDPGDSFGFALNVGSGSPDIWSVWVQFLDGFEMVSIEWGCDVYRIDHDSGVPVYFIIGPYHAGFSIQTPEGQSCMGNPYR